MSASSLNMAAAAAASSSPSLHIPYRISKFSFKLPLIPISSHFPSIPKPLKIITQTTHFHHHLCGTTQHQDPQLEEEEEEEKQEEEEEEELKVSDSAEASRLYVGNLPYSMTSSELAEVFNEAGTVSSVEIVYDRVTDRSRGFAFVTMESVQEAKEAIRMFDGSQVGGRTVKVNFPEVPKGGERAVMGPKIRNSYRVFVDSPYKIYAGNLSWRITSEGLRDAFSDQPGVLGAKVIYERDSGRSRGFGFLSFASADDAESALKAMNEVEVEGRPLRLNLAAARTTPPSTSPPPPAPGLERDTDNSELISSINT